MPAAYSPNPGVCSLALWRMVKGAVSGGGGAAAGASKSSDMSERDPDVPEPRGTGRVEAPSVAEWASCGGEWVRGPEGSGASLGGGRA